MRTFVEWGIAAMLIGAGSACLAGTATDWVGRFSANAQGQFSFGTYPGQVDGYDAGRTPLDWTEQEMVYLQLYRVNGPNWSGPTGFYWGDLETPVPEGGSKTWCDIYLWSYNYTPPLSNQVSAGYTWGNKPPAGYTGILILDYVPPHLNWTGPIEFVIDLTKTTGFYLPCPITDDPYNPDNVTRMHLTVYTYPIPEPSSLSALGFALAGVGIGFVRRRR